MMGYDVMSRLQSKVSFKNQLFARVPPASQQLRQKKAIVG